MSERDFIAAQTAAIEAEAFQARLVEGMSDALLRSPSPPCLLRAPTGSGKTFMISQVLAQVSRERPTLWLWFVPFVNLVQQTEDALAANCAGLIPVMLARGRNQDARPGMVLLSTAQAVASARNRKSDYDADGDDDKRTLSQFVARGRAAGLAIGLVVDEAHIGLEKTTEFGQFAHWLKPEFLIMATATPKDQRLTDFLAAAGMSALESFAVSRDQVVAARLNKRYIEAVVYDLRQSVQTVADLEQTVLRQAWRRSRHLKHLLQEAGVPLTPLLLVQVANGDKTVERAEQELLRLCKIHPSAIGKHSSSDPDPVLMAAIANDPSKEVLIFKQSAGTGFDAPRAFVLASTKLVNDSDFAMQFIGRVMRVARPVREAWPRPSPIPEELDTAYIYLADATAQRGFEAAVQAAGNVQSQLEGQTEKLAARQSVSGAVVFTNRASPQVPLLYDLPLPEEEEMAERAASGSPAADGRQGDLFAGGAGGGSSVAAGQTGAPRPPSPAGPMPAAGVTAPQPNTEGEWLEFLAGKNLRACRRRSGQKNLPAALQRERRPELSDMAKVSETVAARLPISEDLKRNAVRAALNRLKEKEVHTELTQNERHEEDVQVVTNPNALAAEAQAILRALPQVEEEDVRIIVGVLARRLTEALDELFEDMDEEARPAQAERIRLARVAAYWVIRREAASLAELMQGIVAEFTTLEDAAPLPDFMLFPAALPLAASRRNIYGVLPPSDDDLGKVEQSLFLDERQWLGDRIVGTENGQIRLGNFDSRWKLNGEERLFAEALDRADFVAWWHRNPDSKPYSVKLVRGEHKNYFHPDFVVCLSHYPGDEPIPRLVETKENVKDASRKARRVPQAYGKVLPHQGPKPPEGGT